MGRIAHGSLLGRCASGWLGRVSRSRGIEETRPWGNAQGPGLLPETTRGRRGKTGQPHWSWQAVGVGARDLPANPKRPKSALLGKQIAQCARQKIACRARTPATAWRPTGLDVVELDKSVGQNRGAAAPRARTAARTRPPAQGGPWLGDRRNCCSDEGRQAGWTTSVRLSSGSLGPCSAGRPPKAAVRGRASSAAARVGGPVRPRPRSLRRSCLAAPDARLTLLAGRPGHRRWSPTPRCGSASPMIWVPIPRLRPKRCTQRSCGANWPAVLSTVSAASAGFRGPAAPSSKLLDAALGQAGGRRAGGRRHRSRGRLGQDGPAVGPGTARGPPRTPSCFSGRCDGVGTRPCPSSRSSTRSDAYPRRLGPASPPTSFSVPRRRCSIPCWHAGAAT